MKSSIERYNYLENDQADSKTVAMEAPIFNVQRFSFHDGPGIRTLIFFKGCNLKCDWCQNPESQFAGPIVSFDENRCKQSFECAKVCPEEAINLEEFRVNYEKCSNCMKCIEACSYQALRLIGLNTSPKMLMAEILKDQSYYEASHGGVTFSGGEPTLYPKFMAQILTMCQQKDIHTTLETCGTFSFPKWKSILRKVDLIYFDLKIMDPQKHLKSTGSSNTKILENAQFLVEHKYPVEFRLPLVPGFTDDIDNLNAIKNLLFSLKQKRVHLLAYHNMGEAKIRLINGTQKKLGIDNVSTEKLGDIQTWFEEQGIKALTTE